MQVNWFTRSGFAVTILATLIWVAAISAEETSSNSSRKPSKSGEAAHSAERKADKSSPQKVRVSIGRQTTRIVKPLRPDGYPDYFAALNEHCSQGVTSSNNAVVLLVKAFGPEALPEHIRHAYLTLLGLGDLPHKGAYFVRTEEMIERWNKGVPALPEPPDESDFESQFRWAGDEPWSPEEYPIVVEWLAVNEAALRGIAEASKLPRYYDPVVPHNARRPSLLYVENPAPQLVAEAIMALRARAMLQLRVGKVKAAWDDVLACHRLAILAATAPLRSYSDSSLESAVECCKIEMEILHWTSPDAKRLRRMKADLTALPALPTLADRLDVGERYRILDTFCLLARDGADAIQHVFADSTTPTDEESLQKAISDAWFDWNEPLRMANQWYDRLVAIHRLEDRLKRDEELVQLKADLEKLGQNAANPGMFAMNWFTKGSAKAAMGRMIGANFIQWFWYSRGSEPDERDQYLLHRAFLETSLALAAYRAQHGAYPEHLQGLAPKYVAKLPRDLYAEDAPLRYERDDDGFTLYSVGPNGQDEGGGDCDAFESPDDIPVWITGELSDFPVSPDLR